VQALLQSLRCWPEGVAATPVLAMQVQADRQGSVRFSAQQQGVAALAWIVDVPRLEQRLAEAVRYQSAIDVMRRPWPRPDGGLRAAPAHARRVRRGIRQRALPAARHGHPAGLRAPARQVARQWFTRGRHPGLSAPGRPGRARGGGGVVAGQRARRAGLAWDDAALAAHLHELSGGALGALQVQGARATWPLQQAHARRWVGAMPGRVGESWALAGDAAHAVHPLAGQG
jgi:2-polyprenyl-6-methoxyphenol hydroxylase-like FAD-dependent oxidoreductase